MHRKRGKFMCTYMHTTYVSVTYLCANSTRWKPMKAELCSIYYYQYTVN